MDLWGENQSHHFQSYWWRCMSHRRIIMATVHSFKMINHIIFFLLYYFQVLPKIPTLSCGLEDCTGSDWPLLLLKQLGDHAKTSAFPSVLRSQGIPTKGLFTSCSIYFQHSLPDPPIPSSCVQMVVQMSSPPPFLTTWSKKQKL